MEVIAAMQPPIPPTRLHRVVSESVVTRRLLWQALWGMLIPIG